MPESVARVTRSGRSGFSCQGSGYRNRKNHYVKLSEKNSRNSHLGHEHAEHSWFQVEGGKIEGAESARQNWQIT